MVNYYGRRKSRGKGRPASAIMEFAGHPHRVDLAAVERAFFAKLVSGKHVSRQSLARAIGHSRSTITRFFAGRNTSVRIALKILNELDLRFEDIATPVTEDAG